MLTKKLIALDLLEEFQNIFEVDLWEVVTSKLDNLVHCQYHFVVFLKLAVQVLDFSLVRNQHIWLEVTMALVRVFSFQIVVIDLLKILWLVFNPWPPYVSDHLFRLNKFTLLCCKLDILFVQIQKEVMQPKLFGFWVKNDKLVVPSWQEF
jgi:hypothetical protein